MIYFFLMKLNKKSVLTFSKTSFLILQILAINPAEAKKPAYDIDFCPNRQSGVQLTKAQRDVIIEKLKTVHPDFNFQKIKNIPDRNKFTFTARKSLPATKDKDPYAEICLQNELKPKEGLKLKDIISIDYVLHSGNHKKYIPKISIKKMTGNIDILVLKVLDKINKTYSQEKLTAIIFDLTDNLGGNVSATTRLADEFLKNNKVIFSKTNLGESKPSVKYLSTENGAYTEVPIIIHINQNTMSSAESFTKTLKENGYKVLITGKKSYGKNTFQNKDLIPDPSGIGNIQVRYTAGTWSQDGPIKPQVILANSKIANSFFRKICHKIFSK